MEIYNKVAIITGGLGGIGFVTVQHMLKNKAKYVAILDIHKPGDETVINKMEILGKEFQKEKFGYYCCNIIKIEEFTECYEKVTRLENYVDILVNNAGIGDDRQISLMIDVNFKAVVKCTAVALRYMRVDTGGKGGIIVNMASILGLFSHKIAPVYCATKSAVVAFVRSMKEYNKILGVRIVCICPNATDTNMITRMKETYNILIQSPDNVALTIIKIIQTGEDGAVWLSEKNNPPIEIPEPNANEILRTHLRCKSSNESECLPQFLE